MGMSASQARYIALTARMSDTEYEAQQVNQQRLTLSNKMNEVYESLVNMEVPTPPSKIDYAIENYSGRVQGSKVSVRRNSTGKFVAYQETEGQITKRTAGTKGEATSKKYAPVTTIVPEQKTKYNLPEGYTLNADGSLTRTTVTTNDDETETTTTEQITGEAAAQILKDNSESLNLYTEAQMKSLLAKNCYVKVGDSIRPLSKDDFANNGNGKFELVGIDPENILEENSDGESYATTTSLGGDRITSADGKKFGTVSSIPSERSDALEQAFQALKHSNQNYSDAELMDKFSLVTYDDGSFAFVLTSDYEQDDPEVAIFEITNGKFDEEMKEGDYTITYSTSGGIESITTKSGDTSILESEQKFNETEYEEASAKYKYEKTVYDHDQNVLNKQTSIYQRQDKQLELKLTRLDSERNALNTELEAVKKVIQDAIDKGFKTFSG